MNTKIVDEIAPAKRTHQTFLCLDPAFVGLSAAIVAAGNGAPLSSSIEPTAMGCQLSLKRRVCCSGVGTTQLVVGMLGTSMGQMVLDLTLTVEPGSNMSGLAA